MPSGHDVLDDLQEHLFEIINSRTNDEKQSLEIASDAREHFRKHWGGQNIYFKKTECATERNLEIYNAFNGNNHAELSRKYNLTVMAIYSIIKAVTAEKRGTPYN